MSNAEKVLVILSPGFAASEADSTCLPMQQDFVNALSNCHPHVKILVLAFEYPFKAKTYPWHRTTVVSFAGQNKSWPSKLFLFTKIYKTLKRISRENEVVGLLSFWYGECALIGKIFGQRNGIRHCCWILGQDARSTNKYPHWLKPDPEELIALSDFLQDEFEKNHGIRPFKVIPPGLKPAPFNEHREIDVLAVGSLIPLKRLDLLIDVLAHLKKQIPSLRAVLIGDGPEKPVLKKLIEDLGLKDHVALMGQLPYSSVLEYMQKAKLFLHPSSYEGFSGVCMEALSRGARVVSFCRAMKTDIEHWHIVNSVEDMRDKALEILQKKDADYTPVAPFSMKETARQMMALFEKK